MIITTLTSRRSQITQMKLLYMTAKEQEKLAQPFEGTMILAYIDCTNYLQGHTLIRSAL